MASAGRSAQPSRVGDVVAVVHVIRHAVALDRRSWPADDWERPLSSRGRAQAAALAERYVSRRPDQLISSPALRCRQTLEPTAEACSSRLGSVAFLEEGTPPALAQARLMAALDEIGGGQRARPPDGAAEGPAAPGPLLLACTHGDVLAGMIELWLDAGVHFDGPMRSPKAVTFELEVTGGTVRLARFVTPPDAGR